MKILLAILIVLFTALQYRLWIAEGSWADVTRLDRDIRAQELANERLKARNRRLAVEVDELKEGLDSIEERAREDLGMIRDGETFFMVVDPQE
ncbi:MULTISPECIES: cell division protein FtsB [Marinimicrobium]|jgi:cell division protein FtsB|uniref:Cell division protein FtsB n=1 Tax=Marinimicrobium koreense TaxID=306545 RepID=A0A3N1NL39_9GAMM|nr:MULTISPECIES: cell division protein FtsB [Marinimicrobium]MAN51683.1 cell division protein FtsB [Marinimicrobium sp.]ROQ20494.1 cell division protein FtsB [Marinimicrobium koreense]|tara:strand:- start:142 stop:420 length:279 start_codon:yes stop_codon:yes gene_type:complete